MNVFLSHLHDDLRQSRQTRRGSTYDRDHVPLGQHKTYPRLPQIALPEPGDISVPLSNALKTRVSLLDGESAPLTPQEVATLLGLSVGRHSENLRRHYPSGGAIYPIETYLISNEILGQKPAAYHYNPTEHALEELYTLPPQFDMRSLIGRDAKVQLSTFIIFTSMWERSAAKYGDFGYTLALLEAGHMSENMLLVGCALKLGVLPFEKFNDDALDEVLDLDGEVEQPVHSIIVRKTADSVA